MNHLNTLLPAVCSPWLWVTPARLTDAMSPPICFPAGDLLGCRDFAIRLKHWIVSPPKPCVQWTGEVKGEGVLPLCHLCSRSWLSSPHKPFPEIHFSVHSTFLIRQAWTSWAWVEGAKAANSLRDCSWLRGFLLFVDLNIKRNPRKNENKWNKYLTQDNRTVQFVFGKKQKDWIHRAKNRN